VLPDAGCVLIGRGSRRIYELAVQAFGDVQTFDEARDKLPLVMCNAVRDYCLELSEGDIPKGMNVDTFINWVTQSDEMWTALSVDAFLVGYSPQHRAMGVASVWSYQGYELQEIYKPDFIFFLKKDPIKKMGKKPRTKQDMAKGLRRVFQAEKKAHKGKTVIGGGHIDLTVIKKNGEVSVEDMGQI
jgi:hypothetical protein